MGKVNLSPTARQAAALAILALLPAGAVRIYSGTQPAGPDVAPASGNHLLATIPLLSPPFGTPIDGATAATGPLLPVNASGTGVGSWFRVVDGSGVGVFDGTLGVGPTFTMNVNTTNFVSGVPVTITTFPFVVPLSC